MSSPSYTRTRLYPAAMMSAIVFADSFSFRLRQKTYAGGIVEEGGGQFQPRGVSPTAVSALEQARSRYYKVRLT